MKILFTLALSVSTSIAIAQDCTVSLLFRKGTELEYKTYAPKGGLFSKGDFFEVTKLTFVVEDVKDSNNTRYSYITKIGVNPNDAKLKYEKKYIIACNGNTIAIPFDFYGAETIYFSNVYPTVTKDKGIYSSTVYKGTLTYNYSIDREKEKFDLSGSQLKADIKVRDYEANFSLKGGGPNQTGRIIENEFSTEITVKKKEAGSKESITTIAGKYDCYKVIVTTDMKLLGATVNTNAIIYYNPEVGFIKTEAQQSKTKTGYTELVSIKN